MTRLFLLLRWSMTPYSEMAETLPARGEFLDLGCGHGLFPLLLAELRPNANILALDHDEQRIQAARRASHTLKNIRFEVSPIETILNKGVFDVISLIDVLHYFNHNEQENILKLAKVSLRKHTGVLVFREIEPRKGLASWFNRLYERLAVAFRFTKTETGTVFIKDKNSWLSTLERLGFKTTVERASHPLFSDLLYVCKVV